MVIKMEKLDKLVYADFSTDNLTLHPKAYALLRIYLASVLSISRKHKRNVYLLR